MAQPHQGSSCRTYILQAVHACWDPQAVLMLTSTLYCPLQIVPAAPSAQQQQQGDGRQHSSSSSSGEGSGLMASHSSLAEADAAMGEAGLQGLQHQLSSSEWQQHPTACASPPRHLLKQARLEEGRAAAGQHWQLLPGRAWLSSARPSASPAASTHPVLPHQQQNQPLLPVTARSRAVHAVQSLLSVAALRCSVLTPAQPPTDEPYW